MITDYQHDLNMQERERLEDMGFVFVVDSSGYYIAFKNHGLGHGISSSGVHTAELSREDWIQALRSNLRAAIRIAHKSKFYEGHHR